MVQAYRKPGKDLFGDKVRRSNCIEYPGLPGCSDPALTLVGGEWQVDLKESILKICGTREYVREACERSLKRLGVDYIDLYYIHR